MPANVSLRVKNELSREQGGTGKIASELRRFNRKKLNVYARWMGSSNGGSRGRPASQYVARCSRPRISGRSELTSDQDYERKSESCYKTRCAHSPHVSLLLFNETNFLCGCSLVHGPAELVDAVTGQVRTDAVRGCPDDPARSVERQEPQPWHPCGAGQKGGVGAQHRYEAAEEDDLAAVLLEQVARELDRPSWSRM